MDLFKRTQKHSINYYIKMLFLILIPIIVLDFTLSLYVISAIRKQTVQYLQTTASLYTSQLNTTHTSINYFLVRTLAGGDTVTEYLNTDDSLEMVNHYSTLRREFETFQESCGKDYQFFAYNTMNERYTSYSSTYASLTSAEVDQLQDQLKSYMNDLPDKYYSEQWDIIKTSDRVYFFKIYSYDQNYLGCWINAENIINPLKNIDLGKDGFITLTETDGTPLVNQDKLQKLQLTFSDEEPARTSFGTFTPQNMIIHEDMTIGPFNIKIIIDKYGPFERIIFIQFILLGAVLLITSFLLFAMNYMRNRVLKPIQLFSESLAHYQEDTELLDLKDSRILELEMANDQFKNLMRQIKKLKIDIYEQELEEQRTLMNYMQLQIRPHFFLNCLNCMYSMAQTQLYEEIMELSKNTSDYFRYLFQTNQDFVPLASELKHIETYMEIQKLRFPTGFTYDINAEEGTGQVRILPILIQTFIENSLKHSVDLDNEVLISVHAFWKDKPCDGFCGTVEIQIMDTGPGFPEDVRNRLNNSRNLEPQQGHRIGITNAIKRMEMFYETADASVVFSNLPEHGALVTITLPGVLYDHNAKGVLH